MGAWTKLTAVNRMLRGADEHPVNTLASSSGDSLAAESLLDEVNYEFQMVGLTCNTEILELSPNSDGDIQLDDSVLHVEVLHSEDNGDLIVQRGHSPTRLYNLTDNTYTFEAEVTVKIVTGLGFVDLPFPVQLAITDEAARRYQMMMVGDTNKDALLREIWIQSRAKGRAADIRSRALNLFGNMKSKLPYEAAKQTRRRGGGSDIRSV